MEPDTTTETPVTPPIALIGDQYQIGLDDLNAFLAPYKMRVDSLDDIRLDKEESDINKGDVIKIYCVDTNPDEAEFDAVLFFKEFKELEDKFESMHDLVSSCEIDKGDLVIRLIMNRKGKHLKRKLAEGGTIEQMVDDKLRNSPAEIFAIAGIAPPATDADAIRDFPIAREKAIAHYQAISAQPVYVFWAGRKIDLSKGAAESNALTTELARRLFAIAGNKLNSPDHGMQNHYAEQKSIIATDHIADMARRSNEPFHVSEAVIDDVLTKITA